MQPKRSQSSTGTMSSSDIRRLHCTIKLSVDNKKKKWEEKLKVTKSQGYC